MKLILKKYENELDRDFSNNFIIGECRGDVAVQHLCGMVFIDVELDLERNYSNQRSNPIALIEAKILEAVFALLQQRRARVTKGNSLPANCCSKYSLKIVV